MSPSSTRPRKSKQNGDDELWTVYSARVCLPSLLHDPTAGPRGNSDIFTQTWGDDFIPSTEVSPSVTLPYIGRHELMKQLKLVARNRANRIQGNQLLKDGAATSSQQAPASKESHPEDELSAIPQIFFQSNFVLEEPQTFHAVIPWNKLVFCNDTATAPSTGNENGGSSAAAVAAVASASAAHRGPATGHRVSLVPSHGTAKLLEEQLSQYLDLTEVHLARQVSSRSDDVFEAMQCYSKLHEDAASVCAQIRHVRKDLHHTDSLVSTEHLRLLKLARERDIYANLYRKLKLMATVHQTQPTIQMLLATHDYVGALDLIATTQEVLQQELAGMQCFRHLGSQLSELEKMINRMMEAEFVQLATARLDMPTGDGADAAAADEEDQLSAVIIGLIRQRNLLFLTHYRDLCFSSLKSQIRKTVLQFMGDHLDTQDEQMSIAEQMRQLEYPRWRAMLDNVFVSVLAVLQAMEDNHKIILRMLAACLEAGETEPLPDPRPSSIQQRETSTAGVAFFDPAGMSSTDAPHSLSSLESVTGDLEDDMLDTLDDTRLVPPKSGQALLQELDAAQPTGAAAATSQSPEHEHQAPDGYITRAEYAQVAGSSYELLVAACDLAHVRCAKLLGVRTRDVSFSKLRIGEIVQLSRQVEDFIAVTEKITGRQCHTNLRASLMSQCKKVVDRFHEEHRSQLSLILEGERWQQAEVPVELQSLISQLESSRNMEAAGLQQSSSPSHSRRSPVAGNKSHLLVRGEQFAVAGAPLFLLKMVSEYCQCVNDMPVLVSDILNRLLDLLRLFNRRTGSLVLGAEARRSTGLKTITAKHLALASRCLDAVLSYLPLAKAHFQHYLPVRQRILLTEFDPVFQDYRTHRSEILNKLVSMMEDTISRQLAKWEAKAPIPSPNFQAINKQTGKLHGALAPVLSPDQLELVFNNVQLSFRTHFLDRIRRLAITPGGPQHGIVSAELSYLAEYLNALEGLPDLGESLMDMWHHP
ncbi:vacuolar protein sorting-associated protein 54-like isoform X1 [Sycon ciliatum]|uniref:vacuolar protein sorting-associated protein 54-like isoform X1 n=1 Tax=Sycon ciliatum TaxID=27933 RepID=UPI0031F6A0EC